MANRWGNGERLYFLGFQNHCRWWLQPWNWMMLSPWKKSYDPSRQRNYFANKGLSSQCYGFSGGHVWMWELDYKESWAPKDWWFWTVMLEKTLESPLDYREIQPVHSKGNQSWIFIGRTDAEAETPILWPPDSKNWLIGKDPAAGKDWRGGEGDDRGWDGWMASLTQWTWIWVNSRSWWWTGRPGVLQSMESQRVRHDWATELNWTISQNLSKETAHIYLLLSYLSLPLAFQLWQMLPVWTMNLCSNGWSKKEGEMWVLVTWSTTAALHYLPRRSNRK